MIDYKRIKAAEQVDRDVAAAVVEIKEGAVLCEIIEDGKAKVSVPASVSGSEKIAGIAIQPYSTPLEAVSNEQFTVPSSGSLIFNLRFNNVASGSSRAAVVGGSDLTVDATNFSATPPTGTVKLDLTGGRIKFAAGDAGKVVHFIYRYALTVQQARMRFAERAINNRDLFANWRQVSVLKGYIEVSTDQYDTTVNYDGSASLKVGANGIITTSGSGAAIPQGKILEAPDLSGTLNGAMLRFSALIG